MAKSGRVTEQAFAFIEEKNDFSQNEYILKICDQYDSLQE